MPELRWILLCLGAVLVAGLWWWEARRSRAARRAELGEIEGVHGARPTERAEPSLEGGAGASPDDVDIASIRVAPDERRPAGLNPPVLTIDGLPDDPSQVELSDDAPPVKAAPIVARRDEGAAIARGGLAAPGAPGAQASSASAPAGEPAAASAAPDSTGTPAPNVAPAAPATRTAGASGSASAGSRRTDAPVAAAPVAGGSAGASQSRAAAPRTAGRVASAGERADGGGHVTTEPPAAQQRIVAIRLVARTEQLVDGAELRAALEAEGLRFGKYSIFHRQRVDGRAIYSVASLLEPGSFDLDRMETLLFPGISMFAVFPGPIDAPEAFDEMLASARRLAECLDAAIQDEHGVPFTAQRALLLREELVHFQGLVAKTRQR
jgi:cell division protein ZipA